MNGNVLDLRGMKCLKVTWSMTSELSKLQKGDMLNVISDCRTFPKDIKRWCQKHKKVLMRMKEERDGTIRCQIKI